MKRKNEAGQALVFAAVGLAVLMGFAGLGIDMGMLRYQKRLQQTAADSGALAGANNLAFPASGGITTGAKNASAGNGFTDGANNVTVTVNNPPTSGPHNGDAHYVEVLVTAVQPTYFMKVLGINSQTVTARAVATNVSGLTQGGGCLYTLGAPSSAIEGVNINGHATLNAITCGIADNGNFSTCRERPDGLCRHFWCRGDLFRHREPGLDLHKQSGNMQRPGWTLSIDRYACRNRPDVVPYAAM